MVSSAMDVLEFGLKAYCFGDIILFVIQSVIIWSFIILSNIFPIIGIKDIGR